MTEKDVKIQLSGTELFIYGTLRGEFKQPLVILCHGYGGWMHEMLLFNASRYFEKAGYATLRLSMYGGGEKSRNITDSDVMTHASDIDDVVSSTKTSGASWVAVVGHSYSGMAIVYSKKQDFDAAVVWDPTHTDGYDDPENLKNLQAHFIFVDEIQAYVSGLGSGYVYAKSVFDNNYPSSREMSKKFKVPTLVVNANWSKKQQQYGKDYAQAINAKTQHVVIPDSSHPFTENGAAEKLFDATVVYLDDATADKT